MGWAFAGRWELRAARERLFLKMQTPHKESGLVKSSRGTPIYLSSVTWTFTSPLSAWAWVPLPREMGGRRMAIRAAPKETGPEFAFSLVCPMLLCASEEGSVSWSKAALCCWAGSSPPGCPSGAAKLAAGMAGGQVHSSLMSVQGVDQRLVVVPVGLAAHKTYPHPSLPICTGSELPLSLKKSRPWSLAVFFICINKYYIC